VKSEDMPQLFKNVNKFSAMALREFISWSQTAMRRTRPPGPTILAGRRPPAWAPYVLELREVDKPDSIEYYMPLPWPPNSSTAAQVNRCLTVLDHSRISEDAFRKDFLGAVATETLHIKCRHEGCPSATFGQAGYMIRVIPAQYSYQDDSVTDLVKRKMVRRMRELVGNAIYTQDLLLALDTHGSDVEAAVDWVLKMN
jgi:hypothetical protein